MGKLKVLFNFSFAAAKMAFAEKVSSAKKAKVKPTI